MFKRIAAVILIALGLAAAAGTAAQASAPQTYFRGAAPVTYFRG